MNEHWTESGRHQQTNPTLLKVQTILKKNNRRVIKKMFLYTLTINNEENVKS